MKDQTWCKLGDIYITIIYPRLKESISEYFKSSLVWSWMELICLSPSRHIAMAVAFEPKKLPKVSHFSTVSWMMLDASFLAYRFLTCFDVLYRDVGQCWQLVCFFFHLSNVSTKQMKPGASLLDCGPSGRCHGSWVCHACNAWHFSAVRWNDTIPRLFTFCLFKMQKLHMFITNVLSNQVNLQLKHSCNWMSQCLPKHVMSCWECRDLSNWEVSKWDGQIVAALVAAREASSLKIANAGQSYHTFPFRVDHNTQGLPHIHCIEMSLSIYVKWNSSGWQHFISQNIFRNVLEVLHLCIKISQCSSMSMLFNPDARYGPFLLQKIEKSIRRSDVHPLWHTLVGKRSRNVSIFKSTLLPFHLSKYESPSQLSQDSSLHITCKFKQIKFSGYAIKYIKYRVCSG